jgi:hypothetical protein
MWLHEPPKEKSLEMVSSGEGNEIECMVYEWEICLFHFMHYHNFLKKKVPA